jgi:hypothetical protein
VATFLCGFRGHYVHRMGPLEEMAVGAAGNSHTSEQYKSPPFSNLDRIC